MARNGHSLLKWRDYAIQIVVSPFSEGSTHVLPPQKKSKQNQYLQIFENSRQGTQVKQRVLYTLGRLDDLQQSGKIESLLASGARFAEHALLLTAHKNGHAPAVSTKRIGPTLIFERLWKETGCQKVVTELLKSRAFEFDV